METNERRRRASREAADWWAVLQGDDMTKTEREEFIDWLRDSQTHIAEMLRLYQVHGALEQFREWADISTDQPPTEGRGNVVALPAVSPPPLQRMERRRSRMPGIRRFAFAATLVAVTIGSAIFFLPQFRGQWIATERGERREVVLEDGSVVQVDPQTRLTVRFNESQRRVVLEQGRAFFRVARNPHRPFRVEAGDTTVRAIGTAFGVDRRAQDQLVVTVSEGKVAVSSTNGAPSHPTVVSDSLPGTRPAQAQGGIVLTANEQVILDTTGSPQPVRAVDSRRELAWAQGRLVFKNDTVARVIAEFNRYNRVQLAVTDAALAARPITGVFDAANPEGFIAFLQSAAPVHIERDDGRSIVISSSASR